MISGNLHDAMVEAFLKADERAPHFEYTKRDAASALADVALDVVEKWAANEPCCCKGARA